MGKEKADKPEELSKSKLLVALGNFAARVSSIVTLFTGKLKASFGLTAAASVLGSATAIKEIVDQRGVSSAYEIADNSMQIAASAADDGQLASVAMLMSGKLGALNALNGLAIAGSAIQTGRSIAGIVKGAVKSSSIEDMQKEIKDLMSKKMLNSSQKDILKKLDAGIRTLSVINKDKVKISVAETVSNAANLTSAALMATGVGMIVMAPAAVISIGSSIAQSKIKSQDTKKVIDENLYRNPDEKQQRIEDAKFKISLKYARMPEKVRLKYKSSVSKLLKNDDKIAENLREESLRTSGEVNLKAKKTNLLHTLSEDVYNILKIGAQKMNRGVETEFDRAVTDLANRFIEAAGGKQIDITSFDDFENAQNQKEAEKKTIEKLCSNLTL